MAMGGFSKYGILAIATLCIFCMTYVMRVTEAWSLLVLALYVATGMFVWIFFSHKYPKWAIIYFYIVFIFECIYSFSSIYASLGIIDTSTTKLATESADYIYFSIVTWTTLGYGDFRPAPEARPYAASQAALGYLYMGVLIAKLFHWLDYRERTQVFYLE